MEYILSLIMVACAIIPPINLDITLINNTVWILTVLMASFFALSTLVYKTNAVVRTIAVGCFINACVSSVPAFSQSALISVVAMCWYYIACTKVEGKILFNTVKILCLMNIILMVMQALGMDNLLNFGLGKDIVCYGIVGQYMQMSSFMVIACAVLSVDKSFYVGIPAVVAFFCHSTGAFFSVISWLFTRLISKDIVAMILMIAVVLGALVYCVIEQGDVSSFVGRAGRLDVWLKTIELSNIHPIKGWGIGTYKEVFPAFYIAQYKTTHNCFLQILFETGYTGLMLCLGTVGFLFIRLFKYSIKYAAGLSMIIVNMMVHFPTRMIQAVPIIIFFLACCEKEILWQRAKSQSQI